MTLVDKKNNGLYHWFTLGLRKENIFIHPFAAYKFDKEEADRILAFMERK